jgi:hypothetical protein
MLIALLLAVSALAAAVQAHQAGSTIDLATDADYLAQIPVEADASNRLSLRAGMLTLAPGQRSLPLIASGAVVLSVRAGALQIIADRSLHGTAPVGDGTADALLPEIDVRNVDDGTGGRIDESSAIPNVTELHCFELSAGQGAILADGTVVQLRVAGMEPVSVLIVSALT